jgi:hypothetical protein
MRRNLIVVLILAVVTGVAAYLADRARANDEFGQRTSTRLATGGTPPSRSTLAAGATVTAANCTDAKPYNAYRFIEGVDPCLQLFSAEDLAQLQDPFAVNVLQKGVGQPDLWPSSVEQVVSFVSAVPGFAANQKGYLLGEGSQITASVAPRDAPRNLRYVITWGANSSPSVFFSAAPTGTHPGRPASFLQVIGYDQKKNVFNYYQYISNNDVVNNDGQPTRTWSWAGDSTWSRNPQSAGRGCFACHINGALNMKELIPPWNNWNSSRANISAGNIPEAVAQDPLYTALSAADGLQGNFEGLQSRYTQGLVTSSIKNGTVSNVPALLKRLINTTTINFQSDSKPAPDPNAVQVPPDFFIFHSALTMQQINLSFTTSPLTITRPMHDAFVSQHKFALQQPSDYGSTFIYQQPGTTFNAFFVPVPAFEDMVAIREMINQNVIDANFAASVLLVDFPNPVFSAQRSSLIKYAEQIQTAQILASGSPNPNGVPTQFIAHVTTAAQNQPPCNPAALASCTPEQQFLNYAGQSDWRQRARDQINPYFAAIGQRIGTAAGANDYMTMSVSRQSQFGNAGGIRNLDEFPLLLPCSDLTFRMCKRMNVDGTMGDDPQWPDACAAQICLSPQ